MTDPTWWRSVELQQLVDERLNDDKEQVDGNG